MRNKDNECFKWAVTQAQHPVSKNSHPYRVTKELRLQAKKYNWDNITFPMKVRDIGKWGGANGIGVNVFGYDEDEEKLYTMKVCDQQPRISKIVSLYLHDDNHYCIISDLSRLVSSQLSKNKRGKYICLRCVNAFGTEKLLAEHKELCDEQGLQQPIYPEEGDNWIQFENHERTQVVPFVINADFECYIEPIAHADPNPNRSLTTQYQRHKPSGFCYVIKCFDESIYRTKTVPYTAQSPDEDIGKKFVEFLDSEMDTIHKILVTKIPIRMTPRDEKDFKDAKRCYACKKVLGHRKVRDHCHLTGKYRGASCNKCNLRM